MDIDAVYDERNRRFEVKLGGALFTLTEPEVWRLIDVLESEVYGPSLVADHKGD